MGTGQVIEPGLGLHDYVARHYAQPLGRWIAPDTLVPEPGNWYVWRLPSQVRRC